MTAYTREELLTTVDNALKQKQLENENHNIAWQLECSPKLYRYLVDSSPDIIYTLNGDGRFTFINDRVLPLLGFSPADLIGKHYSELVLKRISSGRAMYSTSDGLDSVPRGTSNCA